MLKLLRALVNSVSDALISALKFLVWLLYCTGAILVGAKGSEVQLLGFWLGSLVLDSSIGLH